MTELKDAFEQAAEMVKDLPPILQPAAFDRAVDELLGHGRSKRTSTRRAKAKPASTSGANRKTTKAKKSGRMGGQAAVRKLAEGTFLNTGRTSLEILDHVRTKMALNIKSGDLTSPLAALTREGLLEREKNSEGRYEYKLPS
jgi:hypothetical protein